MNKELTPLDALKDLLAKPYFIELGRVQGKARFNNDIQIIETALKEKGKQDLILNFLKEHIVIEDDVVKADFQWEVEDKETEKAIKEWLK